MGARGIRMGGHGLKVSPGSLLNKAVADGNLIGRSGGGSSVCGGVNGGGREKVFKRSVR